MERKEAKRLERKMNLGATGRLPKSKRLSLKPGPDGIIVTREKKGLAPVSIWLDGREYRRSYQFGNLPSEAIVRANLEAFARGVRAAVWQGLDDGRLGLHPKEMGIANSIFDVEKICADFGGMGARGFAGANGKPLSRGKAFRYAIRQFFKDEEFAKAVCRAAIFDYLARNSASPAP